MASARDTMNVGEHTMKKVNFGSGGRPLEGYINVDIKPHAPGVDKGFSTFAAGYHKGL